MGSKISRIAWLSSIFSRKFEATRSANTPGSLMLSVTMTISGGRFLRFKICSIFSLAVRIKASTSMGTSAKRRLDHFANLDFEKRTLPR